MICVFLFFPKFIGTLSIYTASYFNHILLSVWVSSVWPRNVITTFSCKSIAWGTFLHLHYTSLLFQKTCLVTFLVFLTTAIQSRNSPGLRCASSRNNKLHQKYSFLSVESCVIGYIIHAIFFRSHTKKMVLKLSQKFQPIYSYLHFLLMRSTPSMPTSTQSNHSVHLWYGRKRHA